MKDRPLVYSTERGRIREQPKKKEASRGRRYADGYARVHREKKGRGGKVVCIVEGLGMPEAELKALAKQMKSALGVGGSVKDGAIVLQGDCRERALAWLSERGIPAKRGGG
ncbi:MAG: stress response translation initiation inhibitor YciH [Zetaproteobacteria bacterium]|nr:MAG: stress response translation initiation inhibitor YciH [Zetaproteobacteria bacterium]